MNGVLLDYCIQQSKPIFKQFRVSFCFRHVMYVTETLSQAGLEGFGRYPVLPRYLPMVAGVGGHLNLQPHDKFSTN